MPFEKVYTSIFRNVIILPNSQRYNNMLIGQPKIRGKIILIDT